MGKTSIEEWAQGCSRIGLAAGRFANANAHLSQLEADETNEIMKAAVQSFASKYGVDYNTAQTIAETIHANVSI